MDDAQVRKPLVVAPGQGRVYPMHRMEAVFKADREETASGYSVSEWWLEPQARLPNAHSHDEDHVFYVIDGTLSVQLEGVWRHATKGTYLVIPGGAPHAFENQSDARAGFMSINVPGGFEERMPAIEEALSSPD